MCLQVSEGVTYLFFLPLCKRTVVAALNNRYRTPEGLEVRLTGGKGWMNLPSLGLSLGSVLGGMAGAGSPY